MNETHRVHSVEETWALAEAVAKKLTPGTVIALRGTLGAGKTTFMQGLGYALGVRRPVTSPTFTLSTEYDTPRFKLVHFDLYRITGPEALLEIGYSEYLESGAVVALEWPERAEELIPRNALNIFFTIGDEPETRTIKLVMNEDAAIEN